MFGCVGVTNGTIQGTSKYLFDFSVANALAQIASNRKDCAVLVDLNYTNVTDSLGNNGNLLAKDYKTALQFTGTYDGDAIQPSSDSIGNYIFNIAGAVTSNGVDPISSREYSLIPNCNMTYSNSDGTTQMVNVPASIIYAYQYETEAVGQYAWSSIAGVNRGVISNVFTPDLQISKYLMDTQIITDGAGISFNAIVNIRPYGNTIWGDRTLINQESSTGVKATSYISLRNLVSDIAKTSYNSAIQHTYETNNDVTWMNFKSQIVALLDNVVAANVLTTYDIKRGATSDLNKIVANITIYPNLPVENFDIYINLENGEVTGDGTTGV